MAQLLLIWLYNDLPAGLARHFLLTIMIVHGRGSARVACCLNMVDVCILVVDVKVLLQFRS